MSRIVDIEPLLKKYDRLNEGTEFSPIHFINDLMSLEQQPSDNVFDNIKAEIIQVANEEKVHDEKWALGLRYAVNIIDKYKVESEGVE